MWRPGGVQFSCGWSAPPRALTLSVIPTYLRPFRPAGALPSVDDHLEQPEIIRAPNHLGDFVMALPALAAAPDAHVVVIRWLVPLARLLPRSGSVIPLDRGARGLADAAAAVRRLRPARGTLLPPSFSSALLFRLGGARRIRGVATDRRRLLLDDVVPRSRLSGRHRTDLYLELVTGEPPSDGAPVPVPALDVPATLRVAWRDVLDGDSPASWSEDAPLAGIFPGSNASSRRWEPARFAETARRLAGHGVRVVVFGGAGEAELTKAVAGAAGLDMGGRTDLPLLAAALESCDLLITNDSGPMHLAAAVGTPVLDITGPADPRQTAPRGDGHRILQRLDLPCVPCVRNDCPRSGPGYILPSADRECMMLIDSGEVFEAALAMLGRRG
jgi:ADP-heptose:LPS heptosyltransferase